MKNLSIDIETFSDVDLGKCGIYRYCESPAFDILLFGYAVDGGVIRVVDLASGEAIPEEIRNALTDPSVRKWAFNSAFERICLSRFLGLPAGEYLDPDSWRCTMIWSAYMGLPLSLQGVGAVLGLEKQKLSEGKELIRFFCQPCAATKSNGGRTRNGPGDAPDKWVAFKKYNLRDIEVEMAIQRRLEKHPVPESIWDEYHLDQRMLSLTSSSISIAFFISTWSPKAAVDGLCIIIIAVGAMRTLVPAMAITDAAEAAMLHSLSAQISYYSEYIRQHPGWLFCGVYSDEAVTGTKETRAGFQDLLRECRAGKLDLVITKSISRFARNTVTLLETVRELRELGIDVYFEEQKIHTLSADGELILSILASYAQEESLSASENQKWRIQKSFEAGVPYDHTLLGYRFKNNHYEIEPAEAETVRRIYEMYLSGKGVQAITNELNWERAPTRFGLTSWYISCVQRILRNYTYTGNLILQKTFRGNHLTKKKLINEGQRPSYIVNNAHDPIISLEMFEAVQEEIRHRGEKYCPNTLERKSYPFSGLLVCGCCGDRYRRKTTRTGPIWICKTYNKLGKAACPSKAIPESTLDELISDVALDDLSALRVETSNQLVFCYKDGTESVKQWKDRSRAASWTPEMRALASVRTKQMREAKRNENS